jgi:hypothetical protein
MEQLTPSEWAVEQLKRAPSFAIATAIMAVLLLLSTLVEYSSAARKPEPLDPMQAELAQEEPEPLEDIKEKIEPEKPELEPVKDAPEVDVEEVSPVDAPIEEVTVDIDVTEDVTSDVLEPTDPFPMELTKKMAVIGTEPGTGGFRGALGNRSKAGKRRAAHVYGMPKGTKKSIMDALRWLKKAQNKETGGWSSSDWGGGRNRDRGVSGLALLAFLAYGCTDKHPPEFAATVRRAISYLVESQEKYGGDSDGDKRGWFGERMYTQGICTMALAEAYAMTGRRDAKKAAQAGLDYIIRKQPPHGAFSYVGPGNDVSVTGFQLQALKAAQVAGLEIPEQARKRAERFLDICMSKNYATPYRIAVDREVQGGGTVSMTAAALTGRLFLGHRRNAPDCVGQAEYLTGNDRHVDVARKANNHYAIYYLSLSMFNMGGKYWRSWNEAFNEPLRARQVKEGPEKGSWPIEGARYGRHGGRVYTTALSCLALEVYFRYQRSK